MSYDPFSMERAAGMLKYEPPLDMFENDIFEYLCSKYIKSMNGSGGPALTQEERDWLLSKGQAVHPTGKGLLEQMRESESKPYKSLSMKELEKAVAEAFEATPFKSKSTITLYGGARRKS